MSPTVQAAMETARSVKGSDWFASMDATHGHLTAEEMLPQARLHVCQLQLQLATVRG